MANVIKLFFFYLILFSLLLIKTKWLNLIVVENLKENLKENPDLLSGLKCPVELP